MENIIYDVYKKQTDFFKTNTTKNNEFIIQKLKRLKKEILSNYENIVDALKKDLNKSEQESYISEFLIVVEELKTILKNIKK
jgi:aldehyde dehydrogenase (NAD+)